MSSLPHRIGKYRVVAHLGQGGMARVLLCFTLGVGDFRKLLVVKQLREELASDPDFLSMFLAEARLAARLNHPNVVHTYEVGESDGLHFIAMDYLEGQALNRILYRVDRAKMPLELHLRILAEVLSGLHYAHELRDYDGTPLEVVHRDVSPHNVFVTYEGQVKLVDFGIAKAAGGESLTREGEFKGKVSYIAPEQANTGRVDRRADIFSVGVMLWEALTRKRIGLGQPDVITFNLRLAGKTPSLAVHAPDADPQLVAMCEKAMAHAPEDRFPDAEAFRDALEAWLEGQSRSGIRNVGAFMREQFAADRAEMRATVEAQVKLHEGASSDEKPPILTISTRPPGPDATPVSATPPGSATTNAARAPGSGSMARWVLAALVAAAIVGLIALNMLRGPNAATPPHDAEAADAKATADRVHIEVKVEPATANVTLDGASLASNPFAASVDRDGTLHRIVASAEGFEPVERMVSFDRDVAVQLVLRPLPSAAPSEGPTAEGVAPRVVPRPLRPLPKHTPEPDGTPPARPIDENDPYRTKPKN